MSWLINPRRWIPRWGAEGGFPLWPHNPGRTWPWMIPPDAEPPREPEWDNPPPEPFYPNQRGMPPSGPTVAVENYEAQNPPKEKEPEEKEQDWMNQLLMSALMAGGKGSGRQAPSSYGVGAQVPFGDPWVMRRDWEQDYRNIG